MDFAHHLFSQIDDSGAITFVIRIYDVIFTIVFAPMIQFRPRMFMFQSSDYIGIYPLISIIQYYKYYIELGKIQREMGYDDLVKTILTIIRNDEFKYDHFAGQTLIVHLIFKDTLSESFFEIFN